MEKKIECKVTHEQVGKRIQDILKRDIGLTPREIRRIKFRKNGVLKNGFPARCTETVEDGDELVILLETSNTEEANRECSFAEEPPVSAQNKWVLWPGPLEVLYEDQDLLIVNKPSGMPSHPSPGHYSDTLANRVAWYLMERGQAPDIHMAGRLDKDTSGVMVFAKSRPAAARLTRQRDDGRLKKEYLAWVTGCPEPRQGRVDAPIGHKDGELNRMEVRADGKRAVTHYQVIREEEGCSLIHVTLEQGRTHQIRVHMSSIGHPLLGDPIYGEGGCCAKNLDGENFGDALMFSCKRIDIDNPGRMALHAWRVTLELPFERRKIVVEAKDEMFDA